MMSRHPRIGSTAVPSFRRHQVGTVVVLGVLALVLVLVLGPGLGMPVAIPILMLLPIAGVSAIAYRWLRGPTSGERGAPWRVAGSVAIGLVVVALASQAIPYGRAHSNPPITAEPAWDSPRTRELTARACFACHSNEVEYPWYASVAPFSWAVQMHVDDGRSEVNYSEWNRGDNEGDESAETVIEGEMPPRYFTAFGLNSEAQLTEAERTELIAGLRATFGDEHGHDEDEDEDEDD
jgi:mono/diheme cytochrome c family protein